MSGGLDSTSVASHAKQALEADSTLALYTLDALTLWAEDREAHYAAAVADFLGIKHEIRIADNFDAKYIELE